jgi:hypothetical protein
MSEALAKVLMMAAMMAAMMASRDGFEEAHH